VSFDPAAPPKRQINDDDGTAHAYVTLPFGASEGWRLAVALFALVSGAAGKLLDSLLGAAEGGAEINAAKLLNADLDLGGAVRDLAGALLSMDGRGEVLVKALLRNTTRDGAALDNPSNFDRVYQANYGELAEALAFVVEANGFVRFFGRLLTRSGAGRLVGKSQPAPRTS
jgi:hypothetical protein